ncbi:MULTISPECIES: hypothetical protein [Sorangium]|uniref:Uncharacterized protein n=1 Tax=Sorangium cellulosum TaxID=56 RepID=A0A4P2QRD9_SORCE|nr:MULTISPECIES: hypothetical protein [Sorangium]AUX32491.1 uncharacterized protein SOCE836_046310 [Sorangium cellulosum]
MVARAEGAAWRKGAPPDYHLSNEALPKERACRHASGSREAAAGTRRSGVGSSRS